MSSLLFSADATEFNGDGPILIPVSFTDSYDNNSTIRAHQFTWPQWLKLLTEWASETRYVNKTAAWLLSPTFFLNGGRRCHPNALLSGMVLLDSEHVATIAQVVQLLDNWHVEAFVYSSASNRHDDPHWRVVLPLPALIDRFAYHNVADAMRRIFDLMLGTYCIDGSKLDSGDLYHLPGIYHTGRTPDGIDFTPVNEFHHVSGEMWSAGKWLQIANEVAPLPVYISSQRDDSAYAADSETEPDDVIAAVEATANDIENRNAWIGYGAAIHSALGSAGKWLFEDFTSRRQRSTKMSPHEAQQDLNTVWEGFARHGTTCGPGTIFWRVREQNPDWQKPSVVRRQDEETVNTNKDCGAYWAGRPAPRLKPPPEWYEAMGLRTTTTNAEQERTGPTDDGIDDDPFSNGAKGNATVNNNSSSQKTQTSSNNLWPSAEDDRNAPPPAWQIVNLIGENSDALLFAPSGWGKTFVAAELAYGIATGEPVLGCEVKCRGPVFYWAGEGYHSLRTRRRAAWEQAHGYEPFSVPDIWFTPQVPLITDVKLIAKYLDSALERLNGKPAGLTVVDTLNRALNGQDEDKSSVAARYLNILGEVRETVGGSTLTIHHTGWDTSRSRGSSAFPAGYDTILQIRQHHKDEVTGKHTIEVYVLKQKDDDAGQSYYAQTEVETTPYGSSLVLRPITMDVANAAFTSATSTTSNRKDGLTTTEFEAAINAAKPQGGIVGTTDLARQIETMTERKRNSVIAYIANNRDPGQKFAPYWNSARQGWCMPGCHLEGCNDTLQTMKPDIIH